ncbi:MAG: CHAT domain-containing tetratricopeptide repeat protein [Massilia sp.]|uniref:CHAT domain-containing protein n=1 Tax=Massilia sp. TaxID=1882437 RepID=UPI002FC72714
MQPPVLARRRWLGMLLGLTLGPARADADLAPTYRQLAQLVEPARKLLLSGRYPEAELHLRSANQLIEEAPGTRWPWRIYVLPSLALAVLEQGRADEAVTLLGAALLAHDRVLEQGPEPIARTVDRLESGFGRELVRVEYGRQLATMIGTSQEIGSADDLAHDLRGKSMDALLLPLARALHAAGQNAALAALYRDRIAPLDPGANDMERLAAQEYRLYKSGLLLAQAGNEQDAADAWERARHINARRLHLAMRTRLVHTVAAAGTMRRQLLSAAILLAQRRARLDEEGPALLADLIMTKAVASRYGETIRAAASQAGPELEAAVRAVEDRIAAYPASAPDAGPFIALLLEHDTLWLDVARRTLLHTTGFAQSDASLLSALQAGLDGAAAIGFMLLTPPLLPGASPAPRPARQYLRYCIAQGTIQLRLVGAQGPLERLVHTCRADFLRGSSSASGAATQLASALLHDLPPAVQAAARWIIDPDGALHLLPFDALPDAAGQPLLRRRSISLVTSLQERLAQPGAAATGEAVILADPTYTTTPVASVPTAGGLRWLGGGAAAQVRPTALPETRAEVRAVRAGLARLGIASRTCVGRDASPAQLAAVRRPAVLHVAAHAVLRSAIDGAAASAAEGGDPVELLVPGRQAGLLLARDGAPALMLAKDVARLDLRGTALVVLSACDTGNGDMVIGESIASLRRAVELAGAHSAVTALWPVPSAATVALMATFYRALGQGERLSAALRQAKLALHASGAQPRDWAGFQLSGQDQSLGPPGA